MGLAVLGELVWGPLTVESQESKQALLASADPRGAHPFWLLESSIVPSSWAPQVRQNLSAVGIPLPDVFGAGLGCSPQSLARWKHGYVRPALDQLGWQQRHIGASQLPALFRLCRPSPRLCSSTRVSRLPYENGRSQDVLHGWAPCPAPRLVRHISMWLPLNVITSEQGEAYIPIQTPIQRSATNPQIPFQTSPFRTNESNISKLTLRWVSVPARPISVLHPFRTKQGG